MLPLAAAILSCLASTAYVEAAVVQKVDSVAMTVADADRSREFYEHVLGFHAIADEERAGDGTEHLYGVFGARIRAVTLVLGQERLELDEFIAPRGRPFPADSRSNDHWFQHIAIIVSDMDKAFSWLRTQHVKFASSGPQLLPAWNPKAGGIEAFYFRDPDDHYLEILHFPQGKGDPKWHTDRGALFMGIDHTAIVVADTDASVRFYRDTLGLTVVGGSENYGTEQEHLNNVFGARLKITTLRAASGPGVELLEYLAPANGRQIPKDTHANDLWHWQVHFAADVNSAERAVLAGHYALVSPGIVKEAKALAVNDPDGHSSLLQEPQAR